MSVIKKVDPYGYQYEQILIGDATDGVPNILSPDNIFLQDGVRQKSITKKIRAVYFENPEQWIKENNLQKNYIRNKKLVIMDKENIPEQVWNDTIEFYENIKEKPSNYISVLSFFKKHKIRSLLNKVDSFI